MWSHIDTFRRAVRFGGAPLYLAAQALDDVEIVRAMGYSAARGGARVKLPLRSDLEKLKVRLPQTASQVVSRAPLSDYRDRFMSFGAESELPSRSTRLRTAIYRGVFPQLDHVRVSNPKTR